MSDEPIEITPLSFTRYAVLLVDEWPQRTALTSEWLKMAHVYGGTVDGDTLTLTVGNGQAVYALKRDQKHGQGFVAELVSGNDKANLKSLARKFKTGEGA